MKVKSKKLLICICILLVFFLPAAIVYASSGSLNVEKGANMSKDWFAFSHRVVNEGIISGDVVSVSQYLESQGVVEGDIIGAASEINVQGKVLGDMRIAGATVTLSGDVGKNVNIFSDTANLTEHSKVGGNLLAFSNYAKLNGQIQGYTRLNGTNVVLGGEFYGDVDINQDSKFGDADVVIHILPGAKIHGKLTYKGVNEAFIENGAQIKDIEWIKTYAKADVKKNAQSQQISLWKYIKIIISALIYFFISLLIYRFFPKIFPYQAEIISKKPLNIIGVGLISLALTVVSFITFVFLLAVTAIIASPVVAFVFAAIIVLVYIILIYFSTVPVALFLGNLMLKDCCKIQWRFGAGLALITLVSIGLSLMSNIQILGVIFSTIRFIIIGGIVVIGAGAILYSLGVALKSFRDIQPLKKMKF